MAKKYISHKFPLHAHGLSAAAALEDALNQIAALSREHGGICISRVDVRHRSPAEPSEDDHCVEKLSRIAAEHSVQMPSDDGATVHSTIYFEPSSSCLKPSADIAAYP